MKRVIRALLLVVVLGVWGTGSAFGKEPGVVVGKLFYQVCLMNLPNYEGAPETVERLGYSLLSLNEGTEFGYSDEASGIWGAFDTGQENNAGCSVFHESISEIDSQQMGLELAKDFSESEPVMWKYDGVPSGWVVPYRDKMLYVIFGKGGLSSDVRDK